MLSQINQEQSDIYQSQQEQSHHSQTQQDQSQQSKIQEEKNNLAANFFKRICDELKQSAAIITYHKIRPYLIQLENLAKLIGSTEKKSLESFSILSILRYINQINSLIENIEIKSIKNGISTLFYQRNISSFEQRLQSIKEALKCDNDFQNIITSISDLEKSFKNYKGSIKTELESESKSFIVEVINAFYLLEPENNYPIDEILIRDCIMKLSPFGQINFNTQGNGYVDNSVKWKDIKGFLIKILGEKEFYQIIFITNEAREKLKTYDTRKIEPLSNKL